MPPSSLQDITAKSFLGDMKDAPAYKESFIRMLQMLKRLYDNKITLLAGTDGGTQLALHNELEIFVQAGIPANEVLKIATYNPCQVFNKLKNSGSIQQGRKADLILVDGDPVKNISDIRKVFMVISPECIFYPKKLYKHYDWNYYY
jgi:imidazolonepropionase-like amidohydrolase